MKNISIKDLSKTISIPEGTIRAWTLKPILGEVYEVGKVNIKSLQAGIRKYFKDEEFETKFGFKISEIEIVKSIKQSSKTYVNENQLVEGQEYDIHNYSMVSRWTFAKMIPEIHGTSVFIFVNNKEEFKAMSVEDLNKKNIKIEAVEEQEA